VERLHDIDFGNFYIGDNLYKCLVEGGGGENMEGFVTFQDEKARLYDTRTNEIF
jgi:hypothetical protein